MTFKSKFGAQKKALTSIEIDILAHSVGGTFRGLQVRYQTSGMKFIWRLRDAAFSNSALYAIGVVWTFVCCFQLEFEKDLLRPRQHLLFELRDSR